MDDRSVSHGQTVGVTFDPPKKVIWGVTAELHRVGSRRPIGWLHGFADDRELETVWPAPNLGFVDIGFHGRGDWLWTVPDRLEPGRYELRKGGAFTGTAPIEERQREWRLTFRVAADP
jgi:hypothetical protein